jgi:hypothetical protein
MLFLISNFHRVLNVVCFLLGNSPASEFYIPTFRNTLFHLHRRIPFIPIRLWRWNRQSVPKRRHIKFRRRGITQKKAYNIQNTVKVWNQEHWSSLNLKFPESNELHLLRPVNKKTVWTIQFLAWFYREFFFSGLTEKRRPNAPPALRRTQHDGKV